MKCKINITGQINGNFRLHNAICTAESITTKGMFYSYILTFPSKAAAYKALWEGYKLLRADKEDARASMLHYSAKRSISYDASKAAIYDENV